MTQFSIDQETHENCAPMWELSAALDEVYRLRRALAYEAGVLGATLDYASFPKGRRTISKDQQHRMTMAARGQVAQAYAHVPSASLRYAAAEAGAAETLTRAEFAAGREPRADARTCAQSRGPRTEEVEGR